MSKTKEAFKLIVQRGEEKEKGYLFDEFRYRYYVIATNDFETSPEEIIHFPNQRENSENYNKELKMGLDWNMFPLEDFSANSLFFEPNILVYNLSIALKYLVLKGNWIKKLFIHIKPLQNLKKIARKALTSKGRYFKLRFK